MRCTGPRSGPCAEGDCLLDRADGVGADLRSVRDPALVLRHEPQGLEVAAGALAHSDKRLGSRSEALRFRVESRYRLLVEGLASREAAELLDEPPIRAAVRGATRT
jgi:hypothetical protein